MEIERELGKLGVSLATSFGIEGFLGIHENLVLKEPYPVAQSDEVWLNVRTLLRNVHGATGKDNRDKLNPRDYAAIIHSEVEVIKTVLDNATQGRVQLVLYVPEYKALAHHYPHANIKTTQTQIQAQYSQFEDAVCGIVMSAAQSYACQVIFVPFTFPVDRTYKRVAILTHIVLDLLNFPRGTELLLIESHTGITKPPYQWYTKLKGGTDLYRIPFSRFSLQVFGDKANMIYPQRIALRRIVQESAEYDNWNQYTTMEKILFSIKKRASIEEFNDLKKLV